VSHSINLKPRPQRGFLCIPNFCCSNALRSLHRPLSPTFTTSGDGYRLPEGLCKRLGIFRGRYSP
jgi:hypothetical protein